MLYQNVSGLSKIHEQNLIHCDFHDGNILIHRDKKDKEDKVYICDFGLCQPVKSFLIEYDYYGVIPPFNNRTHDVYLCLSICKDGERPEIIENTPQCYVDLMKKCWNEDPLRRPSSKEVLKIIEKWIFYSYEVSEELKSNIMEFINAPIGQHNNLVNESHPQACDTSSLLNFTSKELNEILENEMLNEDLVSEDLSECTVNLKSLDENTSKKLNEILESEDSQASVRANEMLVSEDLNDYMIKDLESLDEN
ncbi:kinase-like domain-containing protein [Rhizophagus irregularis DAOM 181602=DAOM 197198]|uniref:Kinase-like domain-containing protein n=1 Tax=Rhizophagus irregularis (strain DAOM 181602 / DAOM 197198 / MUCL 43194) TaxID=747089 RepID=A0A2P4PJ28_RHIID|nr:kinase-like domain-containing protein [Rhizophagus irregularis DAOM 181602=DAOM 197198]POG65393.1 kinase-like domain-containing protein [Rhizophagus irregularis DAOM 181602=DAOM 197198]|eukprot:XP_025172259.1 kinase-like domain-containing protein [Rhizophagus irregularis DAOM 181602=DAOM 197198]